MNKRLSWDEIQKQYPDQWVGLTDVERDGQLLFRLLLNILEKHGEN